MRLMSLSLIASNPGRSGTKNRPGFAIDECPHETSRRHPGRLKQQKHTHFKAQRGWCVANPPKLHFLKSQRLTKGKLHLYNWNQTFQQDTLRHNFNGQKIAQPKKSSSAGHPSIAKTSSRPPCKAASAFKTTLCWPLRNVRGMGDAVRMRDDLSSES